MAAIIPQCGEMDHLVHLALVPLLVLALVIRQQVKAQEHRKDQVIIPPLMQMVMEQLALVQVIIVLLLLQEMVEELPHLITLLLLQVVMVMHRLNPLEMEQPIVRVLVVDKLVVETLLLMVMELVMLPPKVEVNHQAQVEAANHQVDQPVVLCK